MPIRRDLWDQGITCGHIPSWPCPRCEIAALTLAKDSLRTLNDWESNTIAPHEFHPTSVTGCFVCLLYCTKCGETCAVSGSFNTFEDFPVDGNQFFERCKPTSIHPPPPMIHIPEECPSAVRAEVVAAFSLYWRDLAASLNRIRNALELVLDDLKISKSTVDKVKRKKYRINLHQRIERLRKKRPALKEICDRMMAVKHLGNAGSHPGVKVRADDVFDGFDILERVLQDMYSAHAGVLARTVKQINQRRGPRKAKS
jgi:Domain of unknown function (DUF4145)